MDKSGSETGFNHKNTHYYLDFKLNYKTFASIFIDLGVSFSICLIPLDVYQTMVTYLKMPQRGEPNTSFSENSAGGHAAAFLIGRGQIEFFSLHGGCRGFKKNVKFSATERCFDIRRWPPGHICRWPGGSPAGGRKAAAGLD